MGTEDRWIVRAAEARRAFDATFARTLETAPADGRTRVLMIRLRGARYAVCLDDCARATPVPTVRQLPSPVAAFVGLAIVEGFVLPVFDLAALLGLPGPHDVGGWLLVAAGEQTAGFVVEDMDGQSITEAPPDGDETTAVVQIEGADCRLVRLQRIVALLTEQRYASFERE